MFNIFLSGDSIGNIVVDVCAMIIVVLFASTFHEWAHAFAAYKNGDLTAKFMGRMTLNPVKHIDPIGLAMLLLVGYGWAKPVPIDSNNFKHIRKGILTTSLAGVIANLTMALISAILLIIFCVILNAVDIMVILNNQALYLFLRLIVGVLFYGILINLTLMAFNLLPIYPLDGFHVVETFTRYDNKFCVFMRRYGMFVLLAFIVGSTLLGRIQPYLDLFGLYIGGIQQGFLNLFTLVVDISKLTLFL